MPQVICANCGNEFIRKSSELKRSKSKNAFCSRTCRGAFTRERGRTDEPLEDRFWARVNIAGEDDCWDWNMGVTKAGYGRMNVGGVEKYAHRIAWELTYGEIPDGTGPHGTCVLHKCDNRRCCNPAHFFLGTNDDNIADMVAKRRHRFGETSPGHKLTVSQAREIRDSHGEIGKVLAERFGVSQTTIFLIKEGKRWVKALS